MFSTLEFLQENAALLSWLGTKALPFTSKWGVGMMGGGMALDHYVIDPALRKTGIIGQPQAIINIHPGVEKLNSNSFLGSTINAAEDYSKFTDENPIMGYGIIPGLAAAGAGGIYHFGKKSFNNIKNNIFNKKQINQNNNINGV